MDLDAVRAQVSQNVFIGGGNQMDREAFLEHEDFLKLLDAYLDKVQERNKKPEVGQYDARPLEKHIAEIDFAKMQSREEFYDEDLFDEADREGDVLILDPRQIKDHVPGFDMGKLFGRGEDFSEFVDKADELVLLPNKDAVKKKQGTGGAIPFDKQLGRPEFIDIDEGEVFKAVGPEAPAVLNDPSLPAVKKVPDFGKMLPREEFKVEVNERDELVLFANGRPD